MAKKVKYNRIGCTLNRSTVCKRIKCVFQIILKEKKLLRGKIRKTLDNRLNVITQREKTTS